MNVGDKIRDYEILRRLGAGGMGSVYLVRDLNLREEGLEDVLYALKINRLPSPSEFAADDALVQAHGKDYEAFRSQALRRFRTEARILQSCSHKGLPRFYSFFPNDAGDGYFLVMDYVAGEPLSRILGQWRSREGQRGIHPQVVTFWIESLADVMEYLHHSGQGIVYRDLKPENIMITPEDRLILVDFGISQFLSRKSGGSAPAAAGSQALDGYGTPEYMAPEQYPPSFLEGSPQPFRELGPPDVRTDVFALGALCYQLLTGSPPMYAFQRMVSDRLAAPSSVNPGVPKRAEEVVLRALRLMPAERFGSVREFAKELRKGLEEAPVPFVALTAATRKAVGERPGPARRAAGARGGRAPLPDFLPDVPLENHLGIARQRLLDRLGKPGVHRLDAAPGSGRTTILRALVRRLTAKGIPTRLWTAGTPPHHLVDADEMTTALKCGGPAAAAGLIRARLSQKGMFVLVDDLSRMDPTSRAVAEALGALAPPPGGGWVLVGPHRDAEALPPMEVQTAAALLWDQSFKRAEEIWKATKGHPTALRIVASWRRRASEGGATPSTPDLAIPELVKSLTRVELEVLRAVALAGTLPVAVLAGLGGATPEARHEAAMNLAGLGLVTLDGVFARPSQPGVSSVVLGAMDEAALKRHRELLAEAARGAEISAAWRTPLLEKVGAADPQAWVEAVREALDSGCEDSARQLFPGARELAPEGWKLRFGTLQDLAGSTGLGRLELLRKRAQAHVGKGEAEEARRIAEEALQTVGEEAEGEARELAASLEALLADVDPDRRADHLERAVQWAPPGREAARHRARLAAWLAGQGREREAVNRARAAMQHLLRDPDPWVEMTLLDLMGDWTRAAELAGRWGDVRREAQFLGRLVADCESRGEHAAAVPYLERLVGLPPDPEALPEMMRALSSLGAASLSSDLYDRAQKVFEQGVEVTRQSGDLEKAALQLVELGRLAVFYKDSARGVARFREALEMAPGARPHALIGLAEAALVEGRAQEARTLTEGALESPTQDPWLQVATRRLLAECCLALNERWPALEHARPALEDAHRLGLQAEADRLTALVAELEAGRGALEVERGRGDLRGRVFQVGPEPARLGRDHECEVVLDEPSVSRVHAVVEWRRGVPLLMPRAGANSTQLNGKPLQGPVGLRPGDRLQLGDVRLIWRQET